MNLQSARGKTASERKPSLPDYLQGFDTLQGSQGSYRIVGDIGNGGMGMGFKGEHESSHPVAIKVPYEDCNGALLSEFYALSRIDHPNVVKAIDLGEVNGKTFIILELLEGQNLHTFMYGNRLDADTAVALTITALDGLDVVHSAKLLHTDIKPANLFLDTTEGVKIIDFGLARELSIVLPKGPFGTPGFMAPEQASGSAMDQRSDIYAVGAVLYEMLTGTSLFIGSNSEVLGKTIHGSPIPIRDFGLGIPEELEAVVSKAIDKNPKKRFRSAIAFREALENARDAIRAQGWEDSGVRNAPAERDTDVRDMGHYQKVR
jgi:serine/threonine-protein kinase